MAKPKTGKKNLQTGRNLPTRYSSYNPALKETVPPQLPTATEIPQKGHWRKVVSRFIISFLLMLLIAGLIIGIWDTRNISSASRKLFDNGSLFDLLSTSGLKQDDNGRVNVLLVGYSIDDPGHPAATLTDSIILLSMNPSSHTGYMLSIPRDLYVNIPGFGHAKINEAYSDGGILLLERVVENDFETQISYYALIDYATVRDTVNALGGIAVNIQSSDPRGLYDPNISPHDGGPLQLSNGLQALDGQTALNLTRARGDAYNSYGFPQADFDRTQHQRQVLTAIKDKLNWKLILNPVKNQEILNAVSANVKTDIKATEIRSIFGLFNSIPSSKLESIGLRQLGGKNYLSSYTTIYGQSALIPSAGIDDFSEINTALEQVNQL